VIIVVQGAAVITAFVSEFMPQISVVIVGAALRELYRTNRQINTNEQMSQNNREQLELVKRLVAQEHDYDALQKS